MIANTQGRHRNTLVSKKTENLKLLSVFQMCFIVLFCGNTSLTFKVCALLWQKVTLQFRPKTLDERIIEKDRNRDLRLYV